MLEQNFPESEKGTNFVENAPSHPTIGSVPRAKLSVSFDQQLLTFLDSYQREHHIKSKSEVISAALRLLRERELEGQYAAAMQEWKEDAKVWEAVTGDGLLGERH